MHYQAKEQTFEGTFHMSSETHKRSGIGAVEIRSSDAAGRKLSIHPTYVRGESPPA
jgi:hypothetical protein